MYNQFRVNATVSSLGTIQTFNNNYNKQELVVKTIEQYPQTIKFVCENSVIESSQRLDADDEVEICFNIKGKDYNGKPYNVLSPWRITLISKEIPDSSPSVLIPNAKEFDIHYPKNQIQDVVLTPTSSVLEETSISPKSMLVEPVAEKQQETLDIGIDDDLFEVSDEVPF